jgi:hypothetical protein
LIPAKSCLWEIYYFIKSVFDALSLRKKAGFVVFVKAKPAACLTCRCLRRQAHCLKNQVLPEKKRLPIAGAVVKAFYPIGELDIRALR